MKQELLKGLTEDQITKVKECKNQEEVLELAKKEGIELTEEQLEAVSGGICDRYLTVIRCPSCGSSNLDEQRTNNGNYFKCVNCGNTFHL